MQNDFYTLQIETSNKHVPDSSAEVTKRPLLIKNAVIDDIRSSFKSSSIQSYSHILNAQNQSQSTYIPDKSITKDKNVESSGNDGDSQLDSVAPLVDSEIDRTSRLDIDTTNQSQNNIARDTEQS
jgi:hypothetical protein